MKALNKTILAYAASLLFGAAIILSLTAARYSGPKSNDFLNNLETKLDNYYKQFPEDRVYLQFDRPFYKPGEDIWFSAFVRDAKSMKASTKSEILHVELINPKGTIEKELTIIARDGRAEGDFAIAEFAPGGLYKIKAYTEWQKNESSPKYFEKDLQVQAVVLPNLKMKFDFHRKAFGAGEEVVAKLELQTNENVPLRNHTFTYTASLDGGKLLEKKGTTSSDGIAILKFPLPDELNTNDGLVNVRIQYNGLSESISRSIPIILNKIELSLFPEGGDLVSNLESNVAFRALNEFGKPADIEAYVFDKESGKKLGSFSSFYFGMGSFSLKPELGKEYAVKITNPKGIDEIYDLPEALNAGFVLNVEKIEEERIILNVNASVSDEMALVASIRGKVYWKEAFDVNYGNNTFVIPTKALPAGVAQVTLFDSKGIERAERLVFANRDRQLNVAIQTDKEKYLPREKVKMTIEVCDERGLPMPASLGLSVVNDQLLSFADDRSGHILSELLLTPDLQAEVEEPYYYFRKDRKKSAQALDYLLMTAGWRRYTWKQVKQNEIPAITHQAERAIVAGQIVDVNSGLPIPNANININNLNYNFQADKEGRFLFNKLDLNKATTLTITAENYSPFTVSVNSFDPNMNISMWNNEVNYGWDFGEVPMEEDDWDDAVAIKAMPMGGALQVQRENVRVKNMKFKKGAGKKNLALNNDGMNMALNNNQFAVQQLEVNNAAMVNDPAPMLAIEMDEVAINEIFLADADGMEDLEEKEMAFDMNMDMIADVPQGRVQFNQGLAMKQVNYYRAREFSAPVYEEGQGESPDAGLRNDFRSTVFWDGNVEVGTNGKTTIEFYNTDEISSFSATAEGVGEDGSVGRQVKKFFTQLPFAMHARMPVQVATEDIVTIPVTLKNNTAGTLTGSLNISAPEGLHLLSKLNKVQSIPVGESKTLFLDYRVESKPGKGEFKIKFTSQGMEDGFTKTLDIQPRGFPVNLSFSGKAIDQTYSFNVHHMVEGSLEAIVTAYPNVVSDMLKGIESILRQPYGCFEQTSTSSYPNVLVMEYLKNQENVSPEIYSTAADLLDKGYKKLVTYETPKQGYEWFGSNPPHEALTAYGLMQFNDMKKVYDDVDEEMIDRTANWLMSRKDGKGGFKRDPKALDSFGRASAEVTNAYIVYALSEAGYKNIQKELDLAYSAAMKSKDPYQLGLIANALYAINDKARGNKLMQALLAKQAKDGSFIGAQSITMSGGISLKVETTALAVMAMIKSETYALGVNDAIKFLVSSRSGQGGFGSTQGTILTLKALTSYAKFSKKTDASGIIEIFVDGEKVAEKAYAKGEKGAIELNDLEQFLGTGNHKLQVKFKETKEGLPYSVAVNYSTTLPATSKECKVKLQTELFSKTASMGETVRLSATLSNVTDEGLPMTMAIIGIPAGLSPQPWQLKEMLEKKVVDFYEIVGNNVVCYYRQMKPNEIRTINFDLKADIPGNYEAPASSAYLYYTSEHKFWCAIPKIDIKNN